MNFDLNPLLDLTRGDYITGAKLVARFPAAYGRGQRSERYTWPPTLAALRGNASPDDTDAISLEEWVAFVIHDRAAEVAGMPLTPPLGLVPVER